MPEVTRRATVVSYLCDHCGKGDMVATGEVRTPIDRKMLVHRCEKCGQGVNLDKKYPFIKPE